MRRLLDLAHHKHSGKLLAHHHTSYRGLLLLLVVVGAALLNIQRSTQAADYTVYGKVSAEIATVPALILAPADTTTVANPDITVSGSCQTTTPSSVVVISDNGQSVGSTVCAADGTFSVSITLMTGQNILVARTVNVTDDYGPDSSPLTVTYQAPALPTGATGGSASSSSSPHSSSPNFGTAAQSATSGGGTNLYGGSPPSNANNGSNGAPGLQLKSQSSYLEFGKYQPALWNVYVTGGQTPYTVLVTWGDGQVDHLSMTADSFVSFVTYISQLIFMWRR